MGTAADHLWIEGTPRLEQLRRWLESAGAEPDAPACDVLRIGGWTVLAAVGEADAYWKGAEVVNAVSGLVTGHRWVCISMTPDQDLWTIERSGHKPLQWVPGASKRSKPSSTLLTRAREVLRDLVPLPLESSKASDGFGVFQYVEWAGSLAATPEGGPVQALDDVRLRRLHLEILEPTVLEPMVQPKVPKMASEPNPTVRERPVRPITRSPLKTASYALGACVAFTALTVSGVQPPGPDAFSDRLAHFIGQGLVFWGLAGPMALAKLKARRAQWWLGGAAVLGTFGAGWALLPF